MSVFKKISNIIHLYAILNSRFVKLLKIQPRLIDCLSMMRILYVCHREPVLFSQTCKLLRTSTPRPHCSQLYPRAPSFPVPYTNFFSSPFQLKSHIYSVVALLTLFLFAFALWQAQAMIYLLIQFQHGTLTLPCNYLSCLLIMSFPTTFILLILYA